MSTQNDNEESILQWFDDDRNHCYFIAWTDNEGDWGLALGEDTVGSIMPDHDAAVAAAQAVGTPRTGPIGRLLWDSKADVKKALRAAIAAINAYKAGIPLPDWALRATAEGWFSPPKGWTAKTNDDLVPKE